MTRLSPSDGLGAISFSGLLSLNFKWIFGDKDRHAFKGIQEIYQAEGRRRWKQFLTSVVMLYCSSANVNHFNNSRWACLKNTRLITTVGMSGGMIN
jgi:hypothetical protein